MKAYGPYVTSRVLAEGDVRTLRGVDRLTGIGVVLHLLPAGIELPHLDHPALLPYTDVGVQDGQPYAVTALPPAEGHPSDAVTTATALLGALAWLHGHGRVHGGVTPAQVWEVPGGVALAGAGLPWGPLGGGFDPPDGQPGPAADLYALGQTLRVMRRLPPGLDALLDPDPARRGTAEEALARLREGPNDLVFPPTFDETFGDLTAQDPSEEEGEASGGGPSDPAPSVSPAVRRGWLDRETSPAEPVAVGRASERGGEPHTTPEPIDRSHGGTAALAEDEPPSRPDTPAPATPSPRRQPIRIGWEEDHSWRVVKTGDDPPSARSPRPRPPALRPWVLPGAATLTLAALLVWAPWREVRAPEAVCCAVTFTAASGAGNAVARLRVVRAPEGSGLRAGSVLGTAPGEIRLPDVAGTYQVRVETEGFEPGLVAFRVPRDRVVTLPIPRR